MLSKVLKGDEAVAEPVPWRRPSVAAKPETARPDTAVGAGANANADTVKLHARIAALEGELDAKARQSYAAGLRAGEEAARRNFESEIRQTVQEFTATIAELAATRGEIMRKAEGDIVRLSIEIARRVLHHELAVDGSALESLVKAALQKLQAQEVYRVRVHPDQEKVVRACLDQTGRGQAISVIADPVQPKGGAIFEISRGALDASVETQLTEIEHGLIEQLEARE